MKTRLGMVTIGQAPRVDVVPSMARILGAGVEIVERGALDDLSREEIARLAPAAGDEVLVTRLTSGEAVFLGKQRITPRVQARIAELERDGVAMTVLLCTGRFRDLTAQRPLLEPDRVLLGVLHAFRFPGRLGVLTPSEQHVVQTETRWRGEGFDPVVVAASPYHASAMEPAADTFRAKGVGLVVLDCIGFRQEARAALAATLEVPVIVANLLVARVAAELLGCASS